MNILKLVMYNFLEETVYTSDDTVFHLQFFESQDPSLTLRLLRDAVVSMRKVRSVLYFYMFVSACVRVSVLKGQTVNQHFCAYIL